MTAPESTVVDTRAGFRLLIPGRPVPKGRPRMGRGGRVYTPSSTRAYEELVAAEWMAAGRPVLPPGPFELDCLFVFARPASHYRTKARVLRPSAPVLPREDLDNLVKIVDALQGLAFSDDRLCARLGAWKRWAHDAEPAGAMLDLRPAG